jgi:hypothetical protein
MTKINVETIAIITIVVMLLYTAVAVASIGRFSQTHAINVKTECTDCHQDSLLKLFDGKHIRKMGSNQSTVIDNFLTLKGYSQNFTGTVATSDVQGICYSCHIVSGRSRFFAFEDFFVDNVTGSNVTGNNVAISGIVLGDNKTGEETENIKVNITLLSVTPDNGSVTLDASVQLMNFSGQQNASRLTTNIVQPIASKESVLLARDGVYGDYYKVYITASGNWENAEFRVGIEGSSYPFLSITVLDGSSPNRYTLPNDFRMQYYNLNYFHTNGSYNSIRVIDALNFLRQQNNSPVSFQYELMNETVRNSAPSYSCSASDSMCHINQKITDLGQKYGINGERFYNHDMELTNIASNCNICHI